jgi:hypothetical protein
MRIAAVFLDNDTKPNLGTVPIAATEVALAGNVAAAQQQQAPPTAGLVSNMLHPARKSSATCDAGGSKALP